MKSIIRTSEWLSVIAPMTQGTCTRETFTISRAFSRYREIDREIKADAVNALD